MDSIRDSFDDRFGDDLFELILSYLPIKDKIRYESVSKRFQTFVYSKQKVLRIVNFCRSSADSLNVEELVTNSEMNLFKFRLFLKKFKAITAIDINIDLSNMTDVVNTAIDNCHHLRGIGLNFSRVRPQSMREFCLKFGPNLKQISLYSCNHSVAKDLLDLLPQTLKLSHLSFDEYKLKLKTMILEFAVVRGQNAFPLLSDNRFKDLKHLDITLDMDFFEPSFDQQMVHSFQDFSRFKNLKVFKIRAINGFGEQSEISKKIIESIANNCLRLEDFQLIYEKANKVDIKEHFPSITHLSGLKRFSFIVQNVLRSPVVANQVIHDYESSELSSDSSPDSPQVFISINDDNLDPIYLKNCKNLLALKLEINPLNDDFFDGIHLIVPQLKQLSFTRGIRFTDKGLESIANLKNLTHLEITGRFDTRVDITFEGIKGFIDSCKRLKFVSISGCIRFVNEEQKKSFKQLLKQNNKIEFRFYYSVLKLQNSFNVSFNSNNSKKSFI